MIGAAGAYLDDTMKSPDNQDRESTYHEFVRLLAEHERRLSAYVHTVIPLWQDAEDVLQNTKLRLWEQFDSFQAGTDFAGWAFTVAGYMVRAHRTHCQRQRVSFNDELLDSISQHMSASSESVSMWEDYLPALVECVKALNAANRKLLRLFYAGNVRTVDIARDMGQAPPAIRMTLLRIRRSLSACVRKRLQGEGGKR
jgi:RNA polymerase sigma-70 factor (ECF subfamily)